MRTATVYRVVLLAVSGPWRQVSEGTVATFDEALAKVQCWSDGNGMRNVRLVLEVAGDEYRCTATTPRGRGGRNIARIVPLDGGWLD
jgi:hypothetical protein